jgi:sodium/hydrogen exchanger-like protein 6/7
MENETLQQIFYLMLLIFLALFLLIESLIEVKKPLIGHTTGIVVILGIIASFSIHLAVKNYSGGKVLLNDLKFDEQIFFELILPLIIFPSGYNMRRKKFFRNIGTIMKFGFIGTIFCFALYSGMTYGLLKADLLKKYNY